MTSPVEPATGLAALRDAVAAYIFGQMEADEPIDCATVRDVVLSHPRLVEVLAERGVLEWAGVEITTRGGGSRRNWISVDPDDHGQYEPDAQKRELIGTWPVYRVASREET